MLPGMEEEEETQANYVGDYLDIIISNGGKQSHHDEGLDDLD